MRKWIKIGLIASLIVILTTTILVLVSKIYFNTTNNLQTPNDPPISEQTTPEIPQNDLEQIIPPSNDNNEEQEENDEPVIQPNPDLPNIDEKPNLPTEPILPPTNNDNSSNQNEKPPINQQDQNNSPSLPNENQENTQKPIPQTPSRPNENQENIPQTPSQPQETPKPENGVKPTQFSLINWFDKYSFIQKTTNYADYFNKNGQLFFNESKLKNNCYELIKSYITKAMNVTSNQIILKININYQILNNMKSVKLMIQWTLKNSGNTINFEKKYYDNIHINLKKVN